MPPRTSRRARPSRSSSRGPAPLSGLRRGFGRCSQAALGLVNGAAYYNIQIFDGKKRVAISWPTKTSYSVPGSALKKGHRYTWYVWPGFGRSPRPSTASLIGKATFNTTTRSAG